MIVVVQLPNDSNLLADAAEAQAKIKSDLPGKEKEFEKKGEAMASRAGQTLDRTVRYHRVSQNIIF